MPSIDGPSCVGEHYRVAGRLLDEPRQNPASVVIRLNRVYGVKVRFPERVGTIEPRDVQKKIGLFVIGRDAAGTAEGAP